MQSGKTEKKKPIFLLHSELQISSIHPPFSATFFLLFLYLKCSCFVISLIHGNSIQNSSSVWWILLSYKSLMNYLIKKKILLLVIPHEVQQIYISKAAFIFFTVNTLIAKIVIIQRRERRKYSKCSRK